MSNSATAPTIDEDDGDNNDIEEGESNSTAYLSSVDESALLELTAKMVEHGHYLGPSSNLADEDFRYSHTFARLTHQRSN